VPQSLLQLYTDADCYNSLKRGTMISERPTQNSSGSDYALAQHSETVTAGQQLSHKDEESRSVLDYSENTIRAREAAIDAALEMTFPASDSPPWNP
jgi:hypothetical protein